MTLSRQQVFEDFQQILQSMGEEWDDSTAVSDDTRILGDLNWRSVEIVYLVNEVQKRYQQVFPFEEFLRGIDVRDSQDASVGEWVDFIHAHLATAACANET